MRFEWLVLLAGASALPAAASTFAPETMTCPVGGETFTVMSLTSISTYGELPDGMPIGSGRFPIALPQCPKNGLVLYKTFSKDEVSRLTAIIAAPEYQALRGTETPYYLAYRLATALGDPEAPWLLLSGTWEAKEDSGDAARARRYNEEFVTMVAALPTGFDPRQALALRARAANALRELGRFEEAERLRVAIRVDPAVFVGEHAARQRQGWETYLRKLAVPIASRNPARQPIDLMSSEEAARRCLDQQFAKKWQQPDPPPLDAFETSFCARPEMAAPIAAARKMLAQ